jgi:hypothetical protein
LHRKNLLEPAYLDRANAAAKRASVAVTVVIITLRSRSGDLIVMNAGLAKPIP